MITAHDAKQKADEQFWSKSKADRFIDTAIAFGKNSCSFRFLKPSTLTWTGGSRRGWYKTSENLVSGFDAKRIARFVELAKGLGYKASVREAQKWTLVRLSW